MANATFCLRIALLIVDNWLYFAVIGKNVPVLNVLQNKLYGLYGIGQELFGYNFLRFLNLCPIK